MNSTTDRPAGLPAPPATPPTPTPAHASFTESLAALESEASVPVMDGEMGEWLDGVLAALDRTRTAITSVIEHDRELCTAILRNDPALRPEVDSLIARRAQLDGSLRELAADVVALHVSDQREAEGRKDEPRKHLEALRDALLVWVTRRRAIETELTGWHSEAIYRERGVSG